MITITLASTMQNPHPLITAERIANGQPVYRRHWHANHSGLWDQYLQCHDTAHPVPETDGSKVTWSGVLEGTNTIKYNGRYGRP